jgi:hypothetical protein
LDKSLSSNFGQMIQPKTRDVNLSDSSCTIIFGFNII